MEREDNFRLKRFKELKTRRAGGKIVCALCKTELEQIEICELCQSCQETRKKKVLVCPLCKKNAEEEELDKEICRKNVCKNVASKVSSSLSKGDRIKFDDVCSCSDAVGDVLKLLCPSCQTKSEKQKKTPAQETVSCEKIQKVDKLDSLDSICSCEKKKDTKDSTTDPKEMNMDDLCKIIGQQKVKKLKEIYLQKQQSEDEIISKLKEVFDNDNCNCGADNKNNQKQNSGKSFPSNMKNNNSDLCPICQKDLKEDNSLDDKCPCAQSFSCAPNATNVNSLETLCSKCKNAKSDLKNVSISDPGLGAGKNSNNRNSLNSKSDTLCSKCKNERGNPKNMTIQFTMSCLSKGNAFNNAAKANSQKKDDLLKVCTHIDDIINLTSQYKTSNSVEEFIEACKDAKCKINKPPGNSENVEKIQNVENNNATGKKCLCKSSKSKEPEEAEKSNEGDGQELGIFVTKYQEVVTVKRFQASDGTIKETRQVITIRTETKNPSNAALSDTHKSNKQTSPGSSLKQKHSTCSSQSGKTLKITLPNETVKDKSSQTSSLSKDVSINSFTTCTISSDGEESRISIEQIDSCSAGAQTEDRDDICDKCKRMAEMNRKPPERSFSESDTQDRMPNECCAPRKGGASKSCCAIKVVPKTQDNLYHNKENPSNCLELLKKILLEADQSTASGLTKQTDDVSYNSAFSHNTTASKKKCNCKPETSNTPSHISCASCPSLSTGPQQKCCHTTKSPNQIKFCKKESTDECPVCSEKEEEKPQTPKCICKSSEDTNKSSIKNACSCVSLEQKNSNPQSSNCPSCASKLGSKNNKSVSSCGSAMTGKSSCSCMREEKKETKTCCMKTKQKCCPKEDTPSCPLCGPKQKPPEPPCPCSKKEKPIPKQSCTSCSSKATKSSSVCPCGEDSKETEDDECCAAKKTQQCCQPKSSCDFKPRPKSSGSCGPKNKGNTIVYMSCFMRGATAARQYNKSNTRTCCTQTSNDHFPVRESSSSSSSSQSTPKRTPCPICKVKENNSKNGKKCSICGSEIDVESSSCNCSKKAKKCSINPNDTTCCSSSLTPKSCCKKIRIECPEKDALACPSCLELQSKEKPPCSCKSRKLLLLQEQGLTIEHKSCSLCGTIITTKSESCICTEDNTKSILKHDHEDNGSCSKPVNDGSISSSSCSICSQLQTGDTPLNRRIKGNADETKTCSICGDPITPEKKCPCTSKPLAKEKCYPDKDVKYQGDASRVQSQKNLKDTQKVDCECYAKSQPDKAPKEKSKTSPKSSQDSVDIPKPIQRTPNSKASFAQDPSKCPLCNSQLQPEETFVQPCSCQSIANSTSYTTTPNRQFSSAPEMGQPEFKCCSSEKSPTCPSCHTIPKPKESPCSCDSMKSPIKNTSFNSCPSMSPTSSTCSCKDTGQQTQKSCYELDVNDQLCFAAAATSYYKNPENQCCSKETSSSCLKCSSNAQPNKSSCSCKSNKPDQSKSKPCAACGKPVTPKPSTKCCGEDASNKNQCCTPSKSECSPKENSCSCKDKSKQKSQTCCKPDASQSQSCCEKPKSKCCSQEKPKEEESSSCACSSKSKSKTAEPAKKCASCGEPITPKPSCKCGDGKKAAPQNKSPARSSSLNNPPSKSNSSSRGTQSCPVCTPTPKKHDCLKPKDDENKCPCKKETKADEKKCSCKKEPEVPEKKCICKKEPEPKPKCTCKKEPEPSEKKCTCKKEPEPVENKCSCKKGASKTSLSSTLARSGSTNKPPKKSVSNTSKSTQNTQASCPVCSAPPPKPQKCDCKKEPKKTEPKCTCKKEPPATEKKCTCKKETPAPEKKCTCKKEPEPPAKKCTCKKEPQPPAKKCTCKKEPETPKNTCSCKQEPEPAKDECSCKPSKYKVITKTTSVPVRLSSSTSIKRLGKGSADEKSSTSVRACPTCGSLNYKPSSVGPEKSSCSFASVKDLKKVTDKRSSSIRIQASEASCPECKTKDAATCTRRTERYDVRNLEMMKAPEPPKKKTCTCFSASYVGVENWGNPPAKASSYHGRCYH